MLSGQRLGVLDKHEGAVLLKWSEPGGMLEQLQVENIGQREGSLGNGLVKNV